MEIRKNEINFFNEGVDFNCSSQGKLRKVVNLIVADNKYETGCINIIFTNDKKILELNKEYLNRNNITDVITFNYNEQKIVNGDIFINMEMVKYNSGKFNKTFENESNRVIIHGVLHLVGYNDNNIKNKQVIRKQEEKYLNM